MKRVQAEYPFENYWLYVIFHKKEGRKQANLILKSDTKVRTTLSYARYKMSVHMGRILSQTEHVDHIDNDKSNDELSNLQILTPEENRLKAEELYRSENRLTLELSCSNCGSIFEYPMRNYRFYTKNGRKNFYCSRPCVAKSLSKSL